MKTTLLTTVIVLLLFLISGSNCKKENTDTYLTCACAANDIKYSLQNLSGTLAFFQTKNRWVITYKPLPGNYCNYFPCNIQQDSLQAILKNAPKTQIFYVTFSGKVKAPCQGEDFGVISGVTTLDYIIIDSLKRN